MTQPLADEPSPLPPPIPRSHGNASPVLVVFLIVPLIGILGALLMLARDLQAQRQQAPLPTFAPPSFQGAEQLIRYPAPSFSLPLLGGETVQLSDYAGKTLFLNFWQTTCPPCIEEMPEFMQFFANQDPSQVALLTINVEETPEQIQAFFEQYQISGIPVALDEAGVIADTYGAVGLPVTFVISPDGVVRFMNVGGLTYDDLEEYVNLVNDPSVIGDS